MEENLLFDVQHELPGGYQLQAMVIRDYPGGRRRRGLKLTVFRSRVWIGLADEPDPLLHRSQEHEELGTAIDSCYSMLLSGARFAIDSPEAMEALKAWIHQEQSSSRTKAI